MKAVTIGKISLDILKFLESGEHKLDGSEKIAALRAAAYTLESVLQTESMQHVINASIHNALYSPKD